MKSPLVSLMLFFSMCAYSQTQDTTSNEIKAVFNQRELLDYAILVSPNPSQGNIHINAPEGAICQVQSTKGTYIGTWESRSDGVHLEELPTGTYVVRIRFDHKEVIRKFLVL